MPFLLELRALMDWMWTDTTLALTSWLVLEDIYANIFQLKCWLRAEAVLCLDFALLMSIVCVHMSSWRR